MDETALQRELRRLKQENVELRRTIEAVTYIHTETLPFRPEEHLWIVQAVATRVALLERCACHEGAA